MQNIRYKSPTEQLYKQMTSNPAFTKRNIQNENGYLLNGWAKLDGHVSHSTELVRMCLACQHFDFNSADWFSDNLHLSSVQLIFGNYGKGKLTTRFSRRLWGSPLAGAEMGRAVGRKGKRGWDWGDRVRGLFPFPRFRAFSLPSPPYVCHAGYLWRRNAWRTPKKVCVGG